MFKLLRPLFVLLLNSLLTVPVYAADEPAKISDIVDILKNIISLLAPAAGIAFFIMLVVGGFKFLTAGDPKAAAGARSTLTYAVIGIILVVAAWLILKLIADFTGANVTTVTIPE